MVFGTSLRVAADATQPLNRRITNLSNAVEKFGPFGFHHTSEHLYRATGARHGRWTAEQLDAAVRLLAEAHQSWGVWAARSHGEAHAAKRRPGYRPVSDRDVFRAWRSEYFTAERRRQWGIGLDQEI